MQSSHSLSISSHLQIRDGERRESQGTARRKPPRNVGGSSGGQTVSVLKNLSSAFPLLSFVCLFVCFVFLSSSLSLSLCVSVSLHVVNLCLVSPVVLFCSHVCPLQLSSASRETVVHRPSRNAAGRFLSESSTRIDGLSGVAIVYLSSLKAPFKICRLKAEEICLFAIFSHTISRCCFFFLFSLSPFLFFFFFLVCVIFPF